MAEPTAWYDVTENTPDLAGGMPAGDAIEAMDDPFIGQVSAGSVMTIRTQEDYDRLSPAQREVVKAAHSAGGTVRAADALRAYQAAAKSQQQRTPEVVKLPDGRDVTLLGGQVIPPKEREAVKMERFVDEQGIVTMVDPTTGRSFAAWDENTGEPKRAQPKMSESQRQEMARWQSAVDMSSQRVGALNNFKDNEKVAWDEESKSYRPSWWGSPVAKVREREMADLTSAEKMLERSAGGVKPADGARPGASPVPSASPLPTLAAEDEMVVKARRAVELGADKAAVNKRLRELGKKEI